ncbi:MAG TPA: ATP-binding protein, partial [Polyangiaceae bacterium]|nr:ATP-binding protein [Polyangiaceae bacterium]
MSSDRASGRLVVRGTEILPDDPERIRRQKLARITLDSMVQFVGLLDAQGTVLEINQVALDAVGITLADVEGKPFWTTFWWQVSDDINRTLREMIARAARGEFVRWDTPIFGRAGGKETIIIDASLCPVTGDDGQVVFICAEGRDITEKKAQERLIATQNLELSGLLQRIRELDEIKTQFFANVSHELRTPLALILGPAQRLIDDDGSLPLADRREAGQVVARNARMLLEHVNDLLDMSRLDAKKLKIQLSDADVAAQLRLLASHFAVLAADRQIDFVVDADEPCVAAVDADKLQRVVMNLLGNAFKFVPPSGRIRCSLRQTPHELQIGVDDSGPGVKPEERQRIFERFRQGDGGINRKVGGTGLGLAIAKEFVEMHRGRIEVLDSELGGARFLVTLPRHAPPRAELPDDAATLQPAPPPDTRPSEAGAAPRPILDGVIDRIRASYPVQSTQVASSSLPELGRPRVLVVEDNADMNRFIAQCLSAQYDVISAFDGREGLETALARRPALIVSDIMMPNVSGVEMIDELRRRPETQSIPVLLLSAKADEDLMLRLLEEGARDFIVKPFSEKDLLVRVRNLIAAEHAREQAEQQRQQ